MQGIGEPLGRGADERELLGSGEPVLERPGHGIPAIEFDRPDGSRARTRTPSANVCRSRVKLRSASAVTNFVPTAGTRLGEAVGTAAAIVIDLERTSTRAIALDELHDECYRYGL
jgi:hypothetical protein